jgi:single-strand DNA-binding protein
MYLNKIEIIGRLGKEPEVNKTGSGRTRCSFSVCTSKKFRTSDGSEQEVKDWHNVTAWGKLGDVIASFGLMPGTPLYVSGEVHYSTWDAPDGTKKTRVDISASDVQVLQPRAVSQSSNDSWNRQPTNSRQAPAWDQPSEGPDDDIPF